MATQRALIVDNAKSASRLGDQSLIRAQWNGLTTTGLDYGQPLAFAEWVDACVQFGVTVLATGVASVNGTLDVVSLMGSNDYIPALEDGGNPVNAGTWSPLKDPGNAPITVTTALGPGTIFNVAERPLWVRPQATGGTGGTWNVILNGYRRQAMFRGG